MLKLKLAKPMLVALAACAATVAFNGAAFADDAQTQALKDQMRIMQQQMQQLQQQIDAMSAKQAAQPAGPPASAASGPTGSGKEAKETMSPLEKKFDNFLKGFYGSLDVSVDYTTKGIYNPIRLSMELRDRRSGQPVRVTDGHEGGPVRAGRLARRDVEQRIEHRLPRRASGSPTRTWTSSIKYRPPSTWRRRPVCGTPGPSPRTRLQGAIGLGDTFVGFQSHAWGKVRFGEMYMPYKTSTDRLNPFGSGLGNYAVIMGNTGGDNRVEFGTRGDDVVAYTSPTWAGFSFDAAYQFGQQIDPNSDLTPLGSPDCNGSNNPGSGNLFLNCDDGGYNRAYSADLKFADRAACISSGPTRFTSG